MSGTGKIKKAPVVGRREAKAASHSRDGESSPFRRIQTVSKNRKILFCSNLGKFLLILTFAAANGFEQQQQEQQVRHQHQRRVQFSSDPTSLASFASSTSTYKTFLYPKCSDDSDCTGEQICYFLISGNLLQPPEKPLVSSKYASHVPNSN